MSKLTVDSIPPEIARLEHEVVNGFPEHGWRGDARLSVQLGVLKAAQGGTKDGRWYDKGEVIALRVEVWRHNEDGTDTTILQRPLERWSEIIPALVEIDPASPMFRDTMDRVEKHNDALHKQKGQAVREAHGEMVEHLWSIVDERRNGRHRFRQMPGRDPARQM